MAAVIGALRVNLGLNSAEFETGMKKANGAIAGISKAFAALGGVAIFAGLTAGIGQAVGRIEETRRLTVQLDKALTNVGNTARTSGKEVSDFADKLERSTGRAAEEVLAVSTNLATFGFSREVFFDAIKLADDMSAAWGGDLKQNVEGLARALADPEKGLAMLTKRGITFTDQQKQMIAGFMKSNDLISAQGVVMDALNEQVKGVAESGFSGLTKAQANATLALETFFETIANSMGVNAGLEMSLVAVAAALDFVSQNFDVIARAAGVAGAAILTALGPTIWATITGAASALFAVILAGLKAVGLAIMANPIGLIAVALAAAVTAAFLFRDEIKTIFGVDLVGAVKDAANKMIGGFVGAYEAVKEAWSNLPTFFGALGKMAWNNFISEFEKPALTINGQTIIPGLNLSALKTGLTDKELDSFGAATVTVGAAMDRDYLGDFATSLGLVGDEASGAATQIAGFGAALDGAGSGGPGSGTGGGVAGGLKAAQEAASGAFDAFGELKSIAGSLGSALANAFVSGGDASEAFFKTTMNGLGNLTSKLMEMAANGLFDLIANAFGGLGSGLRGTSSITGSSGGFFPGFANGTNFAPGGMAWVGERGPELVNLPRGSQVIPNSDLRGGGTTVVRVELSPDLEARILQESAGQSVQIVQAAAPSIASQGAAAAGSSLGNGDFDGGMRRFGVSPQAKRR